MDTCHDNERRTQRSAPAGARAGLALLVLLLPGLPRADTPAPAEGVIRSELFEFSAGDRIVDSGIMNVVSPRMPRSEHFEIVRHPDGARTLTSVTLGGPDGDAYRVEGRWRYGPDDSALAARGIGVYEGTPVTVEISGGGPGAKLSVVRDGERRTDVADCASGCLVDMAPSALAMFTMTRRYQDEAGEPQRFRWIGRALTFDQVLLDGVAEIRKLGETEYDAGGSAETVQQYAFVERLRDEKTGRVSRIGFNLYVTEDQRPLAFAIGSSTVGERVGYEGLTEAIPPRIPSTD